MLISIYTDGGSRNNPGQAAIGYLIYRDTHIILQKGKAIGIATNNVAEYTALLSALHDVIKLQEDSKINQTDSISCYADSNLMVQQLNGNWKVKHEDMKNLMAKIKILEAKIKIPISYSYIPREKNKQADALVNKALDEIEKP